jgi:hypothetical protein
MGYSKLKPMGFSMFFSRTVIQHPGRASKHHDQLSEGLCEVKKQRHA